MRLFAPQRPTMNGRRTWLNEAAVIHRPEIGALEDGRIDLVMLLPFDDRTSKEYHAKVEIEELPGVLRAFSEDPEALVESLYASDPLGAPQVREHPKPRGNGIACGDFEPDLDLETLEDL